MREDATLGHAHLLRESADGEPFQAGPGRLLQGCLDDGNASLLTFAHCLDG
jgi:hypothetical protein